MREPVTRLAAAALELQRATIQLSDMADQLVLLVNEEDDRRINADLDTRGKPWATPVYEHQLDRELIDGEPF